MLFYVAYMRSPRWLLSAVAVAFVLAAVLLSALMAGAWVLAQRTGQSGWVDVVWSKERPLGLGARRFIEMMRAVRPGAAGAASPAQAASL